MGTKKDNRNRVNEHIKAPKLRLIDSEGKQLGIVSLNEALDEAKKKGLDLVEIQPHAEPPVAKIMDYGKHTFLQKKHKNPVKKRRNKVKEIKFRPSTDVGDYEVKLRNLRGFLSDGDKVKVTVWFRGREITHQELGTALLERIKTDLVDDAKVEFFPKLEGRQLVMVLAPKKKGSN